MFSAIVRQRADILQMIAGFAVIDLIEPLLLVFCTGTQAYGCLDERMNVIFFFMTPWVSARRVDAS
jgi:hypothetical protein